MTMIELDGSTGEGGGQILRTALTLAMITGRPFRIRQIRARRAKPGLMRQHLVAVQAAAQICGAEVAGAAVGRQELEFVPGTVRGGDYRVFTAFGEKSVSAEDVARQAVQRARQYLCTKAAVAEYLGDQLMLPLALALAGGGGFTVDEVSMHARTNAQAIELFLPVRFEFGTHDGVDAL
jgi:RNA 3'-terminal phosphate cyclase